ncbi:hypothetical protein ACEWY4_027408 [Coilia grayii]|uniref:Fibrinogen C-terminal domain-containing protein n=1 Tax=Coilia grayii TaxID=363190 RepID=A0ABD1IPR6_9TELE
MPSTLVSQRRGIYGLAWGRGAHTERAENECSKGSPESGIFRNISGHLAPAHRMESRQIGDGMSSNVIFSEEVWCDMETMGGGWMLVQKRHNGSVDFHRTWREYKQGFGGASGEHWLGNSALHRISTSRDYSLLVLLRDADGNEAHSLYAHFHISDEDKNYSLHARGFSGTAGKTSSLTRSGTMFSTKDRDNDFCSCKCAQMASGGWWFEACGPSNLNGVYYPGTGVSKVAYNSIKWYYWKGPSLRATMTAMMLRPADF